MIRNAEQLLCWFILLWGIACSSEPNPEPIRVGEDMCAYCRMAIIEPVFASEAIQSSGEVLKFDDLACLAAGAKTGTTPDLRRIFVHDYVTREWLAGVDAAVVQGSALQTAMGSGSAAFASREAAQKFVAEQGGQILSLQEFLSR